MRIKIITDSTCDLPQEEIQKHDISILPIRIQKGGQFYQDRLEITTQDVFRHVDGGGEICTTAAANPSDLREIYQQFSPSYDAVIMVTIGSGFSSVCQNARIAAEEFDNVYVVDSQSLSAGQGIVVRETARLAEEGLGPQEVCQRVQEIVPRVSASFILDRLDYMRKGGRCSSVVALGANLLKLKPCIEVRDNKMQVGKKYRGALDRVMYRYTRERLENCEPADGQVYIVYPSAEESALEAVRQALKEDGRFTDIQETLAGCTVACHCGPNTIGVMFLAK